MRCVACDRPISDCSCPDIDDRLRAIAYGPEMHDVMLKWCRQCDTHYARCRCGTPAFFIICAGEDITDQVAHGLPNAAGGWTIPDLKRA